MAKKPIPIYTTSGGIGGFIIHPYVYDEVGDWIGWITSDNEVYSVYGHYVGWVNKDHRILRRRADDFQKKDKIPPPAPSRMLPPATVPLPPMMAELKYETLDVLEEMPELLPRLDDFRVSDDEFI